MTNISFYVITYKTATQALAKLITIVVNLHNETSVILERTQPLVVFVPSSIQPFSESIPKYIFTSKASNTYIHEYLRYQIIQLNVSTYIFKPVAKYTNLWLPNTDGSTPPKDNLLINTYLFRYRIVCGGF